MKHVVEVKYTNPAHEHVTLRRRVETVNRVVEAQSADEALNRAANQQRALGFRIQSANILEQKELSEAVDYKALEKPTFQRIKSGETKPVDRTDYNKPTFLRKKEQEQEKKVKSEEAEIDEANMRFDYEAAARPKSSDVKNFLNRDKNARAAAATNKYIRRMTKLGGLGPNQTKKDTEAHMKAHFEEVEHVNEMDSEGYKGHRGDEDPGKGPAKYVKPEPAKKTNKDALKFLNKSFAKKQTNEEAEQVEEGVVDALKKAQVKWKTAHRAVYGKDPSVKSMAVGAIARLAGAKAHTARAVGAAVGGKPVTKQQQTAAISRAGKSGMMKMRSEAADKAPENDVNSNVKGKVAADKMSQKAAEIRKAKIEGGVNDINLEPSIDLHRPATLDPNKRIQK